MGYLHINNLYNCRPLMLMFKQLWALEKIHGTSAHLLWKQGRLIPFSGGASHAAFLALFDGTRSPTLESISAKLTEKFGVETDVCIYGEAYGGSMQAMSHTYGKELKFVVFDIQVRGSWLVVPNAAAVAGELGLDFVDYQLIDATDEALNAARDSDSTQAIKNGCGPGHKREGVVLRPVVEFTLNNGDRVIAKHKREDFAPERKHAPIDDPEKRKLYEDAAEAADEFVTEGRLAHVLDKVFPGAETPTVEKTGDVVKAMVEDVTREAAGEIVDSKELRSAIGKKTATLFKALLQARM